MEAQYHYYAFISYATKDSKWAKWLRHKLSYYHIPSVVKKSKIGVPDKIRPIFIYEYDLAGNQLHKAIEQELTASKYLIVICSPDAAKSEYVNREIETFINQGRQEYIIPFIIDGQVNAANPADECFPPALLELINNGTDADEIRGVNIATNGKHQALVDLVATMLGVRRDVLWNRYKARQLKQRVAIGVAALIALLCGLFYWDYTRATYEYYADYVDTWGVPTGVVELNKEQVEHRYRSYRFEKRRIPLGEPNGYSWRLSRVVCINSAGQAVTEDEQAHNDRFPIQNLTYSPENGVLIEKTFCNEKGRVQERHKLSKGDDNIFIADIESAVHGDGAGFAVSKLTLLSGESKTKSNITRYAYRCNDNGNVVEMTFHANNDSNLDNSAVADNVGVWGVKYDLDSLARPVAIHYLNKDRSLFCNKMGVASRCYSYDSMGTIVKTQCLDVDNNPILNEYQWATAVAQCDPWGNPIEEVNYDTDGAPCLVKYGYAKYVAKYDSRGNMVEGAYYGVDGAPCLTKDGCAKWLSKYDSRGNVVERAFYGIYGTPCRIMFGFAKYVAKYDSRGNMVECAFYGIDGAPCIIYAGIAKWIAKYDARGNEVERAYYGVDGAPSLHKDDCAKRVSKYDSRGNKVECAFYGVDGAPCLHKDGYAKWVAKYDSRGNEVECAFYGVDGAPRLIYAGIAKWIAKYDSRGNVVERAYYGIDGTPCLTKYGYAKWVAKYDSRGNEVECAFYGVDGAPCLHNDGYAKYIVEYNNLGERIDVFYYDEKGNDITDKFNN